jgi:hypothetical protein
MKPFHLLLPAVLAAGPALAQDRAELDRTPIVGNRELPKVLYIVPWKKPSAPPLALRPPGGVLDEAPTTLDREVLRRQIRLQQRVDADLQARAAAIDKTNTNAKPTGEKP